MNEAIPEKRESNISRWIYFGGAVYAVMSFGGADLVAQSILTLILFAVLILNKNRVPDSARLYHLWLFAVLCFFVLISAAFLQSIRLEDHPFEHPIWKFVRDNVGTVRGAISVAPEQTRASLVAYAPLLGFILSLALFQSTAQALTMLKRLSYFSAALALYGIMQHFFFPLQLGYSEKRFYLDSLTAVFVNRNSAGTFFGVGAVLSLSLASYYLRSINLARLGDKLLKPLDESTKHYHLFSLFIALAVLNSIALFLTQSRGAVASTFAAIVLLILLAAGDRSKGHTFTLPVHVSRGVRVGAMMVLVISIFLLFAGQATYRQEAEGIDHARLCAFTSTVEAIRDNWKFGAGFGTFSNVFPAYRDADCAGVAGVWDAAHNSFLEGALGLGMIFPIIVLAGLMALVRAFLFGTKVRHRYRFVPVMGLSVLLLVCLHSLVDFSMQIPGVALFVATIFGCCCVISLEREAGSWSLPPVGKPAGMPAQAGNPDLELARGADCGQGCS